MPHTARAHRVLTVCILAAPLAAPPASSTAHAAAYDTYGGSFRAIAMPPSGAGSTAFFADALPDGRLIGVTGNDILRETAPGSGAFEVVARFDPARSGGAADPAFVTLSPDGATLAVGLGFGKPVAVVPLAGLGTPAAPAMLTGALAAYFEVPHYRAAWRDGQHLALTAGAFGSPSAVTLLDTRSPAAAPSNPVIITNIGGASAAVAFDAAGRLFTGNGFDLGPASASTTGAIKAFDPAEWAAGPADFESPLAGTFIGDVLSADALEFDLEGNLIVGGGDFDQPDTGYLGIVNAGAIARALAGLGPISPADASDLLRLAPRPGGSPFDYYGAAYNPVTGEVYATLTDFLTGANTWYATIPAPGAAALLALALAMRRRR